MSKKLKGVAFDPTPYGGFEDAKARFKHQSLLQDYEELCKETEEMKNKLATMKKKKLTLLAEVRFLRKRHKYLTMNQSQDHPPQELEIAKPEILDIQGKTKLKRQIHNKKKVIHSKKGLPPLVVDVNKKGRLLVKDVAARNATRVFDLNQKETLDGGAKAALRNARSVPELDRGGKMHRGKEAAIGNAMPIIDLNQKERLYSRDETAIRNPAPTFDLNQTGGTTGWKENPLRSRAPIFDLNQISREEEELQNEYEPVRIEEPIKGLIRGGSDEQLNDLKLSACRNVGDGSNRVGKRKISWQDPVALRV